MGEFFLPYDAVRTAADPDGTLMKFLESTYRSVADSAKWSPSEYDQEVGR